MRLKRVHSYDIFTKSILFEDGTKLPIVANFVNIGKNVELSPRLQIGMINKPVERLVIGDNTRIHAGIIAPRSFICGEYVTIHEGVWAYGRNSIVIGHNAWFGMRCTLDAEGRFRVGNGFGAGQDTHLWSHIRHGDIMQGNRFLEFGQFTAGDDVWFVGRCTSSPAMHGDKSMALTESNVTKAMQENHIYGGNPAKDLTDKIGPPFKDLSLNEKEGIFHRKIANFPMRDQLSTADIDRFDIANRTYEKTGTFLEQALMRYLLPEIKFVPKDYTHVDTL